MKDHNYNYVQLFFHGLIIKDAIGSNYLSIKDASYAGRVPNVYFSHYSTSTNAF